MYSFLLLSFIIYSHFYSVLPPIFIFLSFYSSFLLSYLFFLPVCTHSCTIIFPFVRPFPFLPFFSFCCLRYLCPCRCVYFLCLIFVLFIIFDLSPFSFFFHLSSSLPDGYKLGLRMQIAPRLLTKWKAYNSYYTLHYSSRGKLSLHARKITALPHIRFRITVLGYYQSFLRYLYKSNNQSVVRGWVTFSWRDLTESQAQKLNLIWTIQTSATVVLMVILRMLTRYRYRRVWSWAQKMGETGVCAEETAVLTAGCKDLISLRRAPEGHVCSTAASARVVSRRTSGRLTIPTVLAKRWSNVGVLCGRCWCATVTTTLPQLQVRARVSDV